LYNKIVEIFIKGCFELLKIVLTGIGGREMKNFKNLCKVLLVVLMVALQVGVTMFVVKADDYLPSLSPDLNASVSSVASTLSKITGTIAVLLAVYLLGAILFSIGQLVQGSLEGNPMTINYARQALIASLIGEAAIGLTPIFVGLILRATGSAGDNSSLNLGSWLSGGN
jgi:hypothetical protein